MSTTLETVFAGQTSSIIHVYTTATFAQITVPGWLQTIDNTYGFRQGDLAVIVCGTNTTPVLAQVSISSLNVVTLLPRSDMVALDITVPVASLAAAGSVTIMPSIPAQQFKIRAMQLNSGGTNFSGGGGDRLGQVTDGTTVFTVIPAANMQALTNIQWGTTGLPNPASAPLSTATVAGAPLVFKYSGGTADYTAGSLVLTVLLQRVA